MDPYLPKNHRRFTDEEVLRIREWANRGVKYTEIGAYFNVTGSTIGNIARGASYADIGGPRTYLGTGNWAAPCTIEDVILEEDRHHQETRS